MYKMCDELGVYRKYNINYLFVLIAFDVSGVTGIKS